MRAFILAAALAASLAPAVALAQPAPAAAAPAAASHYTTAATPLGTLMDDPKARAIVDKHIPGLLQRPTIDQGRILTLKAMQQYDSTTITDLALTNIDLDLAKLPVKK